MNLADKAVLVNLSISQWSAAKSDKKVNREVATAHNSDEAMGNYRKYLVARDSIRKYTEVSSAIRAEHYRLTLPWRDAGDRILSSAGYFAYAETMRKKQAEIEKLWDEFCANYPGYIAEAKSKLNGLFEESDYPHVSQIRRKFSFKLNVLPVPVAEDFRVHLGDEEIARIQSQIQRDSDAQLNRAMADVWTRMKTVIEAMSERLKQYKVTRDGVEHPFRDSLVTNISELLDIIPILNITGDADITRFAGEMRDLVKFDADTLRESEWTRTDTANRADEILAKMSAFIA